MNYFYQNCGITITPLFRLICVSITLLGRLYSFTRDPQDYERGKRLFEEVKSIAAAEPANDDELIIITTAAATTQKGRSSNN